MKKIYTYTLLALAVLTLTRCFEEIPEYITVTPYDEIEAKMKELRELQSEVNDLEVNQIDLQAKIDAKIIEINNKIDSIANLIPEGNVPLTYTISVVSAANFGTQVAVPDATVTIDVRGERMVGTTDSDGQVEFNNLRSGLVTVFITVEGYTNASYVADLVVAPDEDYATNEESEDYNITSAIALYPTTAENGAFTLSGGLRYDPDRSDDLSPADDAYGLIAYTTTDANADPYRPAPYLNSVNGVVLGPVQDDLDANIQSFELIPNDVQVFAFVLPNATDYGFVPVGQPGNIILVNYEQMFVSTTSSGGAYQLILPAGRNGNSVRVHVEEFSGTETYVRVIDTDNTVVPNVVTTTTKDRTVIYTALYGRFWDASYTLMLPGTSGSPGTFDLASVNNFTFSITGNGTTAQGNIYFGARSRDE